MVGGILNFNLFPPRNTYNNQIVLLEKQTRPSLCEGDGMQANTVATCKS